MLPALPSEVCETDPAIQPGSPLWCACKETAQEGCRQGSGWRADNPRCLMQGILAIKSAEAEGLGKLLACGKDPELVKYYLALEKDMFNNIAGGPLISSFAMPEVSSTYNCRQISRRRLGRCTACSH